MTDWHIPKTWLPRDETDDATLQEQVHDNMLWLYERRVIYALSAVSIAAANETDTTDYSPAGLTYKTLIIFPSFTLQDASVLSLSYNGAFMHSANRNGQIEPVLTLNGGSEYYYSTGTTTKPTFATQGICAMRLPAASWVQSGLRATLSLAAGTYTMKLAYFVNTSTGTLTRLSNQYREAAILRLLY